MDESGHRRILMFLSSTCVEGVTVARNFSQNIRSPGGNLKLKPPVYKSPDVAT